MKLHRDGDMNRFRKEIDKCLEKTKQKIERMFLNVNLDFIVIDEVLSHKVEILSSDEIYRIVQQKSFMRGTLIPIEEVVTSPSARRGKSSTSDDATTDLVSGADDPARFADGERDRAPARDIPRTDAPPAPPPPPLAQSESE